MTEHHLEFLSLIGGCTGLSESTLVKMPHCWKSHVTAHFTTTNEMIRHWSGDGFVVEEPWSCGPRRGRFLKRREE